MSVLPRDTPVLTNLEAAEWLRLTDDYDQPEDAIEALYRIVRKGKLRPLRAGKTYKFTLAELARHAPQRQAGALLDAQVLRPPRQSPVEVGRSRRQSQPRDG